MTRTFQALLSAAAFLAIAPASAADVTLINDVNTSGITAHWVTINNTTYFAGRGPNGIELYATNGSAAGTQRLTDINPGLGDSGIFNLTAVGETLYFVAQTSPSGARSLYKYDNEGLALVKTFASPQGLSNLRSVNGQLFFMVMGDKNKPWKSDGTDAGTVAIPCPEEFSIRGQGTVFQGSSVLVAANDTSHGTELWEIDLNGATLVSDFNPGPASGVTATDSPVVLGDYAYLPIQDGGWHLAKTDGTSANTSIVADLETHPLGFALAGNHIYYVMPTRIYATDGTGAGTLRILEQGTNSVVTDYVAGLGTKAILSASGSGAFGQELWMTDGTAEGTALLKDVRPGAAGSEPAQITAIGGNVYFAADDGVHGREPWVTNGTVAGTHMVADLEPGAGSSNPTGFEEVPGGCAILASTTAAGPGVWLTANAPRAAADGWELYP